MEQKDALTFVASKNIVIPIVLPNIEEETEEEVQLPIPENILKQDTKRKRYSKEIPKKYRKHTEEEWKKQMMKKPNKLRRNEVR